MKKYIILHGHFYQPPREDPWTGLIEHQVSAKPFANWNQRITAECYAACGASRVLDGSGAIQAIINNYRYLSFNFGPTLLSWLESQSPDTYQRIIEADKESLSRLGFGNAVAQAYNHTILPMAPLRDALTQIRWGLKDFSRRFERNADGMWLPECGVNERIIDLLIHEGMRYVILSPWQARAIKRGDEPPEALGGRPAPWDRPFFIQRPSGRLAAFFYHPQLASDISFGHLLRSREGFEKALRNALDESEYPMVSIATDGEIYGHHEPFGDMCLAALVDHLGEKSNFSFTNYAAYLAAHPPTERVELRRGDDGLGTSWSCFHGVGRWMKDCGCSTGGEDEWNQSWRSGLRKAFDKVRSKAEPIWTKSVQELTHRDARDVLDDYGSVLSGMETAQEFVKRMDDQYHHEPQQLLKMLEGAKFIQFMYTSCGWFFSELSGIEPVQNMRYAYRAIELIDPKGQFGLNKTLERSLMAANSNIQSMGTGADILHKLVIPTIPPQALAAAIFFWNHLYNLPGKAEASWGTWQGRGLTQHIVGIGEDQLELAGEIRYFGETVLEDHVYSYKAVVNRFLYCREVRIKWKQKWIPIPINAMPMEHRIKIQQTLLGRNEEKLKQFMGMQVMPQLWNDTIIKALDLPLDDGGRQSLDLVFHYGPQLVLDNLEHSPPEQWPGLISTLDAILAKGEMNGVNINTPSLKEQSGSLVYSSVEDLKEEFCPEKLRQLLVFLEVSYRYGLQPLKPSVQNGVYGLLKTHLIKKGATETTGEKMPGYEDLLALARLVNINPKLS